MSIESQLGRNFKESNFSSQFFKNFQRSRNIFSFFIQISNIFCEINQHASSAQRKRSPPLQRPRHLLRSSNDPSWVGVFTFLRDFLTSFKAKCWLFHGGSFVIHHNAMILGSQTLLILILLNFRGFFSPLISSIKFRNRKILLQASS